MSDPTTGTPANAALTAFAPDLVFANPYQHHSARRFRGDEFDALVEDIRVNGIHQPPPARPHPDVAGAVQLQMGHRRLAAWRVARPGEPFTVIVKPITDLEMLEGVIEENIHRADLNDIERAQMIETYKQMRPDATNADMARVFRLKDPASITNIRKLLKLPAPIQTHVAENNLPDAIARQLVGIAAINPKTAQQIADKVAATPKSEKQDVFSNTTRNLYWNKLIRLRNDAWALDWLADAPVTVARDLGDGDHVIGACAGCVFNVNNQCARKACYEEKSKMWSALEVERVAARLKIPAARADEKTVQIFSGEYFDDDNAKTLLNARKEIRALLRLAPYAGASPNYYLSRVLGSVAVTLVTTDKPALNAYFAELRAGSASKAKSEKPAEETEAERKTRLAVEEKEMAAKRAERAKEWKSKYDAIWLIESASKFIGEQLQVSGDFLLTVESEFCAHHHTLAEVRDIEEALKKEIKQKMSESMGAQAAALRRQHIALNVICGGDVSTNNGRFDFVRARKTVQKLATLSTFGSRTEGFGITLPDGWDVPPVHHTAFNCWHCGTFAGNTQEKLTKRDVEQDGWIDLGKDGVFCNDDHRALYEAASNSAKPNAKAKTKTKAKSKRK